jgi:hypothetical protein
MSDIVFASRSFEHLRKIWCQIKSEHRAEFIAIFDGGDIIGDTSREALLGKIRQKVEDKDLDSVFQTYISKTDDIIWWFFYETILMSDRLCLFCLINRSY